MSTSFAVAANYLAGVRLSRQNKTWRRDGLLDALVSRAENEEVFALSKRTSKLIDTGLVRWNFNATCDDDNPKNLRICLTPLTG
jgi:hypothetical protein